MDFGIWDDSIQEHPEQKKRFASALTSKVIPISVDKTSQTGVFNGSGKKPYNTSLSDCTCMDFTRRHLPCKHIYRLAVELGLIDTSTFGVAKGAYGTDDRTLKDRIKAYINTLNEGDAHILARYFYEFCNRYDHKLMRKDKVPEVVLSCEVFEDSGNLELKLTKLKKPELIELFADTDLKVKQLSKPDLVDLAKNTNGIDFSIVSELVVDLQAKEMYKPVLNALHLYVHKLHPRGIDYDFLF